MTVELGAVDTAAENVGAKAIRTIFAIDDALVVEKKGRVEP